MKKILPWLKASRIPAQIFIFPSLLIGQSINYQLTNQFNFLNFLFIHIYGICMHLFIVYANDYADYETDRLNQTFTPFTGGSRVLIDGEITLKNMLKAAMFMIVMCIMIGIYLSLLIGSISILILIALGIILFVTYSFNPVRLSYRGFGETLQMLGVGVVLPLLGFLSQGGELNKFPWLLFLIILPSQLAMAISTSLPDEPSDKLSSKNTTVVVLGPKISKNIIILLYLVSILLVIYKLEFNYPYVILISILGVLLIINWVLFNFINSKPGTKSLFIAVFISILINSTIMLWMTHLIFKGDLLIKI